MSSATRHPPRSIDASVLFDTGFVEGMLARTFCTAMTDGSRPSEVRVERYWPVGDVGVNFEWSFTIGSNPRCSVFGSFAPDVPINGASRPEITADGVRRVRSYFPEWNVLLHSTDRDPHMRHLADCLQEETMARRLAAELGKSVEQDECCGCATDVRAETGLRCRLLGYRAGRRAAIAYLPVAGGGSSPRLMGKTYRTRRGQRLLDLHRRLNEQVGQLSDGRVRVPAPIAFIPSLRLALFSWSPGAKLSKCRMSPEEKAEVAANALAVLHRTNIADLGEFTAAHERETIQRWIRLLKRMRPEIAVRADQLARRLSRVGQRIGAGRQMTIHRDFYGDQILCTKSATTLVDLDTVARGDPAVDLGNWLTHEYLELICGGGDSEHFGPIHDRLAGAYESLAGPIDRAKLTFYCASAALRVGAVHALRSQTGCSAGKLWAFAEDLLDNSFRGVRP